MTLSCADIILFHTYLDLNSAQLHVNIDTASAMKGPPRTERMGAVSLIPVLICSAVRYRDLNEKHTQHWKGQLGHVVS